MTVLPIPHMISQHPTVLYSDTLVVQNKKSSAAMQPDGAKKEMGHIIIIEPHSVSVFMHNRCVCLYKRVGIEKECGR